MREVPISRVVLAPASVEFPTQDSEFADGWLAPQVIIRKAISSGFQLGDPGFEQINLAARAGLLSIEAAGVQEKGTGNLVPSQIDDRRRDQRPHAPIPSKDVLHVSPLGWLSVRHIHDEVEHRVAGPIWLADFSQARSKHLSLVQAGENRFGQGHLHRLFPPGA